MCVTPEHPACRMPWLIHSTALGMGCAGHGRSEIPEGDPEESWLTDSLCESLEVLVPKGEKVLMFGNSLGGLVAIKAALLCPDRFAGLILASPAGAPISPTQLEGLKEFFKLSTHQSGVAFMSRVTAMPHKIPSLLMHVMAWACRARVSTPTIHRIMTKASTTHMLSAKQLGRLKVPAMLIWGKVSIQSFFLCQPCCWFTPMTGNRKLPALAW